MTASLLLVLAAATAVVDWWAVATRRRGVEVVAKPLALALLVGVALAVDAGDPSVRWLVVVGLALSLVGDVALLGPERVFLVGLGSFLLAHLAYVAAFVRAGVTGWGWLGLAVVAVGVAVLGRRVVSGARAHDVALAVPVAGYVAVISAMVVVAVGTGVPLAALGALLFYGSDSVLGWDRFVAPLPHGRLATMVTYHLGQGLIVLALPGLGG